MGIALLQPGHRYSLTSEVKHFVSPSEAVIGEEVEFTFEQLLGPYIPLPIPEEDTSEVPHIMKPGMLWAC